MLGEHFVASIICCDIRYFVVLISWKLLAAGGCLVLGG